MRILIDGDIYSRTSFGGMVRYYNQLISGLTARGINVDLLVHDDVRSLNGTQYPNCRLVRDFDQAEGYDIFHGSYYSDFQRTPNAKIIVTIHDMIDELLPRQLIECGSTSECAGAKENAIRYADHLVAISNTTKRDILRLHNVPDNQITVIYHGVDEAFGPIDYAERRRTLEQELKLFEPYILHVGGRNGYKNFAFLLEAYANSKARDVAKLVAVGSQRFFLPDEDMLVERYNLQNDVLLTGYVSDTLLNCLYSHASIVVMPSMYEGFGYPMIEAMACGATIACSSAPALVELGHGVPLVFNAMDIDGAIKILDIGLTEDHSQRNELGKKIASSISLQGMIDRYIETYQRLCHFTVRAD